MHGAPSRTSDRQRVTRSSEKSQRGRNVETVEKMSIQAAPVTTLEERKKTDSACKGERMEKGFRSEGSSLHQIRKAEGLGKVTAPSGIEEKA